MKYYNYDIVFQEIPDEVSLAVNITNCPNHCEECHSKHLWDDIGAPLTEESLDALTAKYKNLITCVCLMGGDGDANTVANLLRHVQQHSKLKTAWYSGRTAVPERLDCFNYLKLGPYIRQKGGLKSKNTNQRLYKVANNQLEDITARFWRDGEMKR